MMLHSWEGSQPFMDGIDRLDQQVFSSAAWGLATWRNLFENRDLVLKIECHGARIIGFAAATWVEHEGELLRICVESGSRNKGIGFSLLEQMGRELTKSDVRSLSLEVREENAPAIRLYRRFGFVATGRRLRYYSQPVSDAVLYTISLKTGQF
jgi:[ribosomal protein S18]-alanine N-acetyltransferase